MSYYQYTPNYRYTDDSLKAYVLQKVMNGLLLAGFITAAIVYLTPVIGPLILPIYFLAFGVEIVAIIGYYFVRSEARIETLYYAFVSASAVILGITISTILAVVPNGMNIVFQAFGITALIVGGIYYQTSVRQPDVSNMPRYLFPALIILFVLIIINIFIAGAISSLFIGIFGAILFSAYLYYDLGRLMRGQVSSPARMAWQIYWDILLIFKFILQILLATQRSR